MLFDGYRTTIDGLDNDPETLSCAETSPARNKKSPLEKPRGNGRVTDSVRTVLCKFFTDQMHEMKSD